MRYIIELIISAARITGLLSNQAFTNIHIGGTAMNNMVYCNNWYPDYKDLLRLIEDWPYESGDLLKGSSEYPLQYFRYGDGSERIVFISRIHGHEPAGTSGTIAFLKTLMDQSITAFDDWWDKYTLDIIPMVNVDAAIRYAAQVPDSYPPNRFKRTEKDYLEYKNILTSPGKELFDDLDMRVHHLDAITMTKIKDQHITLGTLYSEEGIELARDWSQQQSIYIKALLQFLRKEKTDYFIDIHCHELPSQVYQPFTEKADMQIEQLKKYSEKLIELLRIQDIPCTGKQKCSNYGVRGISNDYIYHNLGIKSLLWEINVGYNLPPSFQKILKEDYEVRSLSKSEITRTVYLLMYNFISGIK